MSAQRDDPALVHFYRAVVGHMDVWRQRMDATTNWAAATTAGMITFSFSQPATPHHVLLLALTFQLVFLLMESRRFQTFDLWRRRFRVLNRAYVSPALTGVTDEEWAKRADELDALARDLGRTVPHLSLRHALGYRIRRNYGYLTAITLAAWLMKLELHPTEAASPFDLVERARVAAILPGGMVMLAVTGVAVTLAVIAATAPTHDIVDWEAVPTRWHSWSGRMRKRIGGPPSDRDGPPSGIEL